MPQNAQFWGLKTWAPPGSASATWPFHLFAFLNLSDICPNINFFPNDLPLDSLILENTAN